MESTAQSELAGVIAENARSESIRKPDGTWVFQLSLDAWEHLQLTDANGQVHRDVSVVPLFPVSASDDWITILASDGEELLCVRDLRMLSEDNRNLIRSELAFREFVPLIQRVVRVSGTQEPCEWVVETNYGPTSFVLNSEEDVRRINAWSVNFVDANGGRYRVDDLRKLDHRSRAFVEWYV
jgi:hypothetical protein